MRRIKHRGQRFITSSPPVRILQQRRMLLPYLCCTAEDCLSADPARDLQLSLQPPFTITHHCIAVAGVLLLCSKMQSANGFRCIVDELRVRRAIATRQAKNDAKKRSVSFHHSGFAATGNLHRLCDVSAMRLERHFLIHPLLFFALIFWTTFSHVYLKIAIRSAGARIKKGAAGRRGRRRRCIVVAGH